MTRGVRVLLIGGEGATDPVIYEHFAGQAPDEVFARQLPYRRASSGLAVAESGK